MLQCTDTILLHVFLHYVHVSVFCHDSVMFRQACGRTDGDAVHPGYLYNKCGMNFL